MNTLGINKKGATLQDLTYMILDDDRFARNIIRTALAQFGARSVVEADNAIKAIELLKTSNVDVILLDQEMPGITGLEFARLVRRGEEGITNKDVPIIIITGNTDRQTVIDAKTVGIQEYIVKPISPINLEKRLQAALAAKLVQKATKK